MTVVIPNVFQDGDIEEASGVEVNENFDAVKVAIEAIQTQLTGFIQGALPANTKLVTGAGTITWSGGIGLSIVAHGLGKLPIFAHAVAVEQENNVQQSVIFYNTAY